MMYTLRHILAQFTLLVYSFRVSSAFTVTSVTTYHKSIVGYDPDVADKVNQDAAFSLALERYVFCGVLDGHGKRGHLLNAYLCPFIERTLKEKLVNNPDPLNLSSLLEETFEEAQQSALIDENVPAGRSGTTCVTSVFDKNTGMIYTANVGDSRCIVGYYDTSSINDTWYVEALSEATTTGCPEERERIEQGEGRIDKGGNVWYGPVGIAMTRSLGNGVMKRANILSKPVITKCNILSQIACDSKGKCLIITGTDGIFDVMTNEEVVHRLAKGLEDRGDFIEDKFFCDDLIAEAHRLWRKDLPMDVRIDDASCSVISISFKT